MSRSSLLFTLGDIVREQKELGEESELNLKRCRVLLAERNLEWSDEEWKTSIRPVVKDEAERLLMLSSPAKPSPQRKAPLKRKSLEGSPSPSVKVSKYERAAEKNLGTFMAMIGGNDGSEEEAEEDDVMALSDDEDDAPKVVAAVERSMSKDKATNKSGKKTRVKKEKSADIGAFKSNATISDSDGEGADASGSGSGGGGASASVSVGAEEEPKKKKRKSDTSVKERKKPREKKAPVAKAGDAAKGTANEEDRINKLKALIVAAQIFRPFNAATGAERTLSAQARINILERLLNDVGLKTTGKGLPSISKAKQVGERRELEKEMMVRRL
ncbi:hypothetical protein P7C70_g4365, partial [Phenoliferia sp. Uapishka_3]